MKKIKKFSALAMALVLALSLVGCGGKSNEDPEKDLPVKKEYVAATIEDRVYSSEFAGMTATLDESWQILTQEEIAQVIGLTSALVTDEDLKEAINNGETVYDLYAMTATGSTLNITVGDLGLVYGAVLDMKILAQSVADQLVPAFTSMGFENVTAEVSTLSFAGSQENAIVVTGQMEGIPMYEVLVCKKVHNYVYTITACTYGEDGTTDILALFQSL